MRAPLRIVVPALASLGLLACSSNDPITSQGLASNSVTQEKLADKSVTNPKLADQAVDARTIAAGAVTATAIADNAVTSPAIADGSVGTSDLAAKAVTTGTIDDSAVTTPKINDAAVTAAKLAPNAAVLGLNGLTGAVTLADGQNVHVAKNGNTLTVGIAGNVDAYTIRGNDPATFAPRDNHLITVAKQGGDYATITAALAAITNAGQNDANGNPISYVIKVGPGTYNERVAMKAYVDIEGSGTGTTIITSTAQDDPSKGTVVGASNAQLRDLTVKSLGPGSGYATAFAAAAGTTPSLRNVQLIAQAAGAFNGYGLYARGMGANVDAKEVTVVTTGGNPYNYGLDSEVSAQITCRECSITVPATANSFALQNSGGAPVYVANSQIVGSTSGATCFNVYDQTFQTRTCN